MKKLLAVTAVAETATGVALLIVPSLVGQLLLGAELTGTAITVARVTGIALIALGVACWPGTPLMGMLTYSTAVTLFLAYVGFTGEATGPLFWPVVVLHLILTALLARASTRGGVTKAQRDRRCSYRDAGCGANPRHSKSQRVDRTSTRRSRLRRLEALSARECRLEPRPPAPTIGGA